MAARRAHSPAQERAAMAGRIAAVLVAAAEQASAEQAAAGQAAGKQAAAEPATAKEAAAEPATAKQRTAQSAAPSARSRLGRRGLHSLRRLAAWSSWLARALEDRRVAYPALVLLQLKVIWGDWDVRDLTPGDTADYFVSAYGWFSHLTVEIVRSPLYTAFYGSLLHLSTDVAVVTYLHRLLIVVTGDVLLLALLRRLLPAGVAWLVAGWWTLLLGNFDVMYEVHLFGLLPLLLASLVAASAPNSSAWGRGGALAILLGGALLVRNELAVPFLVVAAACVAYELRGVGLPSRPLRGAPHPPSSLTRGAPDPPSSLTRGASNPPSSPPRGASGLRATNRPLLAYAAPLALVLVVTFGLYLRSTVRFPAVLDDLRAKHTLNICQVYAFAYAQQHPDWPASPWTECDGLMQHTFGQPRPTLLEALRTNPRAMLGEFVWNARLARAGLEFALFNAASSSLSPDFAQVQTSQPVPRALSVGLVLLVLGGAVCLLRNQAPRVAWRAQPVWAWLVLLAGGFGASLVLLIERPRAEYLYGLSVLLMAAAGWSAAALANRWSAARRGLPVAVGAAACALAVWPGYYMLGDHARPRDLLETYERLRPYADLIADPASQFLKGDYNAAVGAYLGQRADGVFDYSLLDQRDPSVPLVRFLDQHGITLVYLDEPLLARLEADEAHPEPLLEAPESVGWRLVAGDDTPEARWRLLQAGPDHLG